MGPLTMRVWDALTDIQVRPVPPFFPPLILPVSFLKLQILTPSSRPPSFPPSLQYGKVDHPWSVVID